MVTKNGWAEWLDISLVFFSINIITLKIKLGKETLAFFERKIPICEILLIR